MRRNLLIWLPLLAFAGLFGIAAYALKQPPDRTVHSALVGKPLPDFTLPPMLPGREGVVSAAMKGKGARLINVFASWCIPCIAEAPQLMAIKQAGVRIDAIAVRDTPQAIRGFLAQNGDPYAAIGSDREGAAQLSLGSSGVPESFVVDSQGKIVLQHIGDIRADDVAEIVAAVKNAK